MLGRLSGVRKTVFAMLPEKAPNLPAISVGFPVLVRGPLLVTTTGTNLRSCPCDNLAEPLPEMRVWGQVPWPRSCQ